MPLSSPPDDISAKQLDKLIAHLTADSQFNTLVDLPILPYPPDGMPATHPERVCSIWFVDSEITYADNASNKEDNIFRLQIKVRESGTDLAALAASHRLAMNLKDVAQQALWRYRKDDCTSPPALWWRMQFAVPSGRIYRLPEEKLQVVEVGFKVTSLQINRPK